MQHRLIAGQIPGCVDEFGVPQDRRQAGQLAVNVANDDMAFLLGRIRRELIDACKS